VFPEYYKWRSRSGCYFRFSQRREEWLGLHKHHPKLFQKAIDFEKVDPNTGEGYTWINGMTLNELLEKKERILTFASNRKSSKDDRPWQEKLIEDGDDIEDQGCLICSL